MSVGIGIVGFAHAHVLSYCGRWRELGKDTVRLVAGWDHDPDRAVASGQPFDIEVHDRLDQLLDRKDVDAVVIGAETSMHADLVEQAAAAGKTIVLQKPMALTMDQADHIVGAVADYGVRFTMAWQMRIDPQNVQMKKLIADGVLGRVYMVRRRHGLSTHLWDDFENTWTVKPHLNRGMWADDAAHPIDMLLWLLGEPETVTAEIDTLRSPRVPDDHGVAVFRYADGTFAEVMCSFICAAGENTTEIVGEKGVVIQNYGDAPSCNVPRPRGGGDGLKWYRSETSQWVYSDIASPPSHGARIAALAEPMLMFMDGRRDAIATAEEGRTALRMTLACYRAAELGRRVRIDEV